MVLQSNHECHTIWGVKTILGILCTVKVKVKWSRYMPGVVQRVGRGIALLLHDHGTRRGWVVSSTPRPPFTSGKTRYPFYRRLGGPQGRSGRAENLLPTKIRSRSVQSVVSRYTDWATRPSLCTVQLEIRKRKSHKQGYCTKVWDVLW